jgi:hypothetical protein
MVFVEVRTLRAGDRAQRMLLRLEDEIGAVGIDVVGGRTFPVEAPDWRAAAARLDEALTRVAGDSWRDYLAFVAPQGFEASSPRDRV